MAADISPETYTEYRAKLLVDPNYQYFMNYKFHGIDNCKGLSWTAFINDKSFFDTVLFRHESLQPLTANQMVNYTISYLTCMTAIDMLVNKCTTTNHIFKGNQDDYRLFLSAYLPVEDRITISFETINATIRQVFTWNVCVICDSYIPLNRPLTKRISITGPGFGNRYLGYTGLCKDTTFDLIEDLIKKMEY